MSEPARIEQVITQFFAKSLHIILEVRSPCVNSRNYNTSSSSSSTSRLRDEWLRDYPSSLEDFDLCRQSNFEPLVIDVVLTQMEHKREKIVERWFVQYKTRKRSNVTRKLHFGDMRSGGSHSPEISSLYNKIYKYMIILLLSLCSTVRLLPAYKVFQNLNSSGCPFSLSHKISSFAEPFTRAEDAEMDRFSFTPVETFFGRLSLSVLYVITLEDMEPSRPVSAQFIADYVGSPRTERLKKLLSVPSAGSLPSISRRHSWSVGRGITPSISPFPSPTYSDSHPMQCSQNPGLPLRSHPLDYLPSTPLANKKKLSLNQYWLSPPFSPSSSPSAPAKLPNIHLKNVLLQAESAPLSAPLLRLKGSSGLVNQALPSSHIAQATTCSHTPSPGRKVQLKKRLGEVFTGMNLQKMLYCRKDEFVNLHGRKMSSCTSLQTPTSSSSRLSLLNKFDDSNFVCPFACDEEDSRGLCRIEVSDADSNAGNTSSGELIPVRRSTDAAVGVLVQMLKTALPLRQNFTNTVISSQANKEALWTTKRVKHNKQKEDGVVKTASNLVSADALGELRRYKDIKELILRKRGYQELNSSPARKPVSEVTEVTEAGLPSLDFGETEKSVSEGIEGGPHSFAQAFAQAKN